jgi:hypothetical protein
MALKLPVAKKLPEARTPVQVRQKRVRMPKVPRNKINASHMYDTSPMGYKRNSE